MKSKIINCTATTSITLITYTGIKNGFSPLIIAGIAINAAAFILSIITAALDKKEQRNG